MKLAIGMILLILIFTALAGCLQSSTNAATETPENATSLGSMVDYGKLNWFTVHMTLAQPGINASNDIGIYFNMSYNGTKTTKYEVNYTSEVYSHSNDAGNTSSVYSVHIERYENATGDTVGGRIVDIQEGNMVRNGSAETSPDVWQEYINMWTLPWNIEGYVPLEYAGQDTITANNRTYDCKRYVYTSKAGGNGTAWINKDVPVPIKMTEINGMINNTLQLTGWE